MKRIFSLFLIVALFVVTLCAAPLTPGASAAGLSDHISVIGYDPKMDYMKAIQRALDDGSVYAMQVGAIYECQRNLKIDDQGLSQRKTSYFTDYTTAEEIKAAIEAAAAPKYTRADLDLLSRLIYAEAGCTWIPDWVQRMVGSVVLNRMESEYYPNTLYEVIYQPCQYSPTINGSINKIPDSRTVENARYLLEHGSICPKNVTGQNSVITGDVYRSYHDAVLGTTIYFCYY